MTAAVILAGTFAPTVYHSWSTPEQGMKMVLLLVLTVVALCIIGFLYYKRLMKACDSILDRLKMKEEECMKRLRPLFYWHRQRERRCIIREYRNKAVSLSSLHQIFSSFSHGSLSNG